tara:strand:+ start:13932 stop:14819 length:888 start_codon:yes stop_codon:yes gene_type:complete
VSKKDTVVSTKAFSKGNIKSTDFGYYIATYSFIKSARSKKKYVINLGTVMLGTQSYFLGVCKGERFIFLGLNGKVWKIPGKVLKNNVAVPTTTDLDALRSWSDTISQRIVDTLSPRLSNEITKETNHRYNLMVRSLVGKRIEEAAVLGYDRSYAYYAQYLNSRWKKIDLVSPRFPTMKHALHVSLILALPAKTAATLIEIGSLSEFRCPLISKDIAMSIYQQAVQLLSRLCPEWWNNGAFTQWEYIGSLDELLYKQYANIVINAYNNKIDLPTAAGAARSDTLASYSRRTIEFEE